MSKIGKDNLSPALLDLINNSGMKEQDVITLLNQQLGDLNNLQTANKTVVGAINEVYQQASSSEQELALCGKHLMVEALDSPNVSTASTFVQIGDEISAVNGAISSETEDIRTDLSNEISTLQTSLDSHKSSLYTTLNDKGFEVSESDTYEELLDSLRAIDSSFYIYKYGTANLLNVGSSSTNDWNPSSSYANSYFSNMEVDDTDLGKVGQIAVSSGVQTNITQLQCTRRVLDMTIKDFKNYNTCSITYKIFASYGSQNCQTVYTNYPNAFVGFTDGTNKVQGSLLPVQYASDGKYSIANTIEFDISDIANFDSTKYVSFYVIFPVVYQTSTGIAFSQISLYNK